MQHPIFESMRLHRKTDPVTSKEAAKKIAPHVQRQAMMVLRLVAANPDFNAVDLGRIMAEADESLREAPRKRMSYLAEEGLVERTIASGGMVCKVTEKGKELLEKE